MPRISYFPVEQLEGRDREYLEHAARHGTPRPESQAIRAHVPAVLHAFSNSWTSCSGTACSTIRSRSCAASTCPRRSSATTEGPNGLSRGESKGSSRRTIQELLEFERSERFDARQKAALRYTSMLVWNPEGADDAVWADLRRHFSEEQIVELGCFVALTYGQQRWIKTLGIGHGELLDLTRAGLAQ